MSVPLARSAIFAGRDVELAALIEQTESAIRGKGTVTVVLGAPGMGKSRLVETAAEVARRRGSAVINAANYAHVRSPFGPFADALRSLRERLPKTAPNVSADRLLYDRLIGLASDEVPPSQWDKRRLFVIVYDVLTRAAAEMPIVLAIDDMHWADPESVELAGYLAARVSSSRIALVFTSRDLEAASIGEDTTVEALERLPSARRIDLRGITHAAAHLIASTISKTLDGRMLDVICERGDGNPFFIEELARAARERPESIAVPQSLKTTTLRHVRTLDAGDRELLEVASALGRTFEIDSLMLATGGTIESIVRALRRARDRGIIEDVETHFRFRHELLRVALYDGMLAAERGAIHRRIAENLDPETTPPAVCAHHWAGAGERKKAASWAERAGDVALDIGGYASARDAFLTALESGVLATDERARVDEKIAQAYHSLGDAPETAKHLARALEAARAFEHDEDAARIELMYALALYRTGRVDDAIAACRRVIDSPEATSDHVFAAHVALATYHAYSGRDIVAREHIAIADATDVERPTIERLRLEWARAYAAVYANDEAWLTAATRAIELAETGLPPLTLAAALMNFAGMTREKGRSDLAPGALQRAIAIADTNGLTIWSAYGRAELLDELVAQGRLHDAYATLVEIAMMHVTTNIVNVQTAGLGLPVLVELERTDLLPQFAAEELLDVVFATGEQDRISILVAAHAYAAWMSGRTEDAERLVERALAAIESPHYVRAQLTMMARCGSAVQIETIAAILQKGSMDGLAATYADLVNAMMEKNRSNKDAANRLAERARQSAHLFAAPLLEAVALEILGRRDDAIALYDRCGATASIKRLGMRRSGTLSKREEEVAALLRAGKTNRAIADALCLSERTVEHHVAAIFSKTGVRSRAEYLLGTIS